MAVPEARHPGLTKNELVVFAARPVHEAPIIFNIREYFARNVLLALSYRD